MYGKQYTDPRWQKKRLEVMEAAGFACQLCAETSRELHIHHPKYVKGREPWEYDNLLCLCSTCHDRHHGVTERKPYVDPLWILIQYDAQNGNKDAMALRGVVKHPIFNGGAS